MADKVSTIRLQYKTEAVGTSEAESRIDKLNKSIARMQIQNERMARTARDTDDAGKYAALNQKIEQNIKLIAERQALIERGRSYVVATQMSDDKLPGGESRNKTASKEALADLKSFDAEMTAKEAARDKELKAVREAQAEIEAEETKSGERILAAKQKLEEQAIADRERYAKIARQVDSDTAAYSLRVSARSLEAQAADERAFTEFLAKEKTRQDAIGKAFGPAASGAATGGGGKGMGGALSGFGGKMVLGMAAGRAAGDVIGDRHGGQEIGGALSAFMFGGPVIGTAVVGMELLGTVIKAQRDIAKEAAKATAAYGETLVGLAQTWSSLSTGVVDQSSFGKKMEAEMDRASAAASKLQVELSALKQQGPSFGETMLAMADVAFGHGVPQTGYGASVAGMRAQIAAEKASFAASRSFRNEEYSKHIDEEKRLNVVKAEGYKISGMEPGALREQAKLTNEAAQARMRMANTHRQQIDQADAGVVGAKAQTESLAASIAEAGKNNPAAVDGLYQQFQIAGEKLAAARRARAALTPQQKTEAADLDPSIAGQQASLDIQKAEHAKDQTEKTEEAKIRATMHGNAEADAIADARQKREIEKARMQGPEMAARVGEQHFYEDRERERAQSEALEHTQLSGAEAHVRANERGYQAEMDVQKLAFAQQELEASRHSAAELAIVKKMHEDMLASQTERNLEEKQQALSPYDKDAAIAVRQRQEADMKAKGWSEADIAKEQAGRYVNADLEVQIELRQQLGQITSDQAAIEKEQLRNLAMTADQLAKLEKLQADKKLLAEREDVSKYEMSAADARLSLAEKQGKVSKRDAEIVRAMMADPLAREKGAAGDKIRKEITAMADAHAALEEGSQRNLGRSSNDFVGGHVNFRALAGSISGGHHDAKTDVKRTNELLEASRLLLEKIAGDAGGIS